MTTQTERILKLEQRVDTLEKSLKGLLEQSERLAGVLNDVWGYVKQMEADVISIGRAVEKAKNH